MRKVISLPAILAVFPVTFGVLGCGSSPQEEVTSNQRSRTYEVYDSSGALKRTGEGSYRPASSASQRYVGTAFAGKPYYQYPLVSSADRPQARAATLQGTPVTTTVTARSPSPRLAPTSLLSEVKVRKDYISTKARGRRDARSMKPRYITIHSTQNWSKGADAWRHSLALKNSKLGRLSWHYTVDENVAVQHLPTNITGNHADFDGPGNRYSIGIEMCEHPGNSRNRTVERTAKLAAYLMYKYDIPIARVVPHYHWPRYGMNPAHKNCPHFLLDHGRPGPKWRAFQGKVQRYYKDISSGGTVYVSR